MLLTEHQVRKVVRKTIVENNFRVNERFYRQLERNLLREFSMQDIANKLAGGGMRALAGLALFGAAHIGDDDSSRVENQKFIELVQTTKDKARSGYDQKALGDILDAAKKQDPGLMRDVAEDYIDLVQQKTRNFNAEREAQAISAQIERAIGSTSLDDIFEMFEQDRMNKEDAELFRKAMKDAKESMSTRNAGAGPGESRIFSSNNKEFKELVKNNFEVAKMRLRDNPDI